MYNVSAAKIKGEKMNLALNDNKIKFDKETKDILNIFAKSECLSLQAFSLNVLRFVPELMKTTTNNGVSFINKKMRINSVETDEILKNDNYDKSAVLSFFEFQSTLHFNEINDRLEISVTLNGVTKFEKEGVEQVDNNTQTTSGSRLIYDKNDQSGMLIQNLNQPNERKISFIVKDEVAIDCENLDKYGDKNNSNNITENDKK